MNRLLPNFPSIAAIIFLVSSALFFSLNPYAFQKLATLNLLQFNLARVNYAFVMALFAYTIPGLLIAGYCLFYLRRLSVSLKVEIILLLIASCILMQLGSISVRPEFSKRTLYVLALTWVFPLLHVVLFVYSAFKYSKISKGYFLYNSILATYIMYEMVYKTIFYPSVESGINVPIVMSFLWYLSIQKQLSYRVSLVK